MCQVSLTLVSVSSSPLSRFLTSNPQRLTVEIYDSMGMCQRQQLLTSTSTFQPARLYRLQHPWWYGKNRVSVLTPSRLWAVGVVQGGRSRVRWRRGHVVTVRRQWWWLRTDRAMPKPTVTPQAAYFRLFVDLFPKVIAHLTLWSSSSPQVQAVTRWKCRHSPLSSPGSWDLRSISRNIDISSTLGSIFLTSRTYTPQGCWWYQTWIPPRAGKAGFLPVSTEFYCFLECTELLSFVSESIIGSHIQ